MNEGKTTVIFGAVAAVALGMAWWAKPEAIGTEDNARKIRVGQDVFLDLKDTDAAASLQIVKYDEDLAQLKRFEVARDKKSGLWRLPSNDDYPADAAEQVRDATTPLVGLKVLSIESFDRGDHTLYGVVNPDEELSPGKSGVGMLVRLKDAGKAVLASLIIGKSVDQAEGQRYARIPSEDAVYTVEIDTEAFKTDFKDWIEGELLGVRSFDITKVAVRDYELQRQSASSYALQQNFDADVAFDTTSSEWSLTSMQTYEGRTPVPAELAEGEELNSEFLNDLKTAVQDLEINNVRRKPKGLAANLKVDEALLEDQESIANLGRQGFLAAAGPDGTEIYAKGGETIIGTDDGVDYVLRFGEATASLTSGGDDDESGGLSRYLLVTARLDESKFPAPDLEPLPETVEEMLALEKADASENASSEDSNEDAGSEITVEPTSDEAEKSEPAKDSNPENEEAAVEGTKEKTTEEGSTETPAPSDETPSGDQEKNPAGNGEESPNEESPASEEAAEDKPAEEPDCGEDELGCDAPQEDEAVQEDATPAEASEDKPSSDQNEGEAGNADTESENQTKDEAPVETEEELEERLEALREKIAKENQRKIDERNEKMDAARKKVQELNARFSEWYYVVADSVYAKLKITRDVLIKTAEPAEAVEDPNFTGGIPGLEGISLPPQN